MRCPNCGRQGFRRKDLWTPDDPASKLKCSKCGEWGTLKSWNFSDSLAQRRAEALEVLRELAAKLRVEDRQAYGTKLQAWVKDDLWERAKKIAGGE